MPLFHVDDIGACCLKMILYSFGIVTSVLFILIAIIYCGTFDSVPVECGVQYYAEAKNFRMFPPWCPMPFNTVVNLGYPIVGIIWLFRLNFCNNAKKEIMNCTNGKIRQHIFKINIFLWMTVLYGPVQLLRILTQRHFFAILDQWLTLPFFSWSVILLVSLEQNCTATFIIFWSFLSYSSYLLTLISPLGFEIVLAVHVIVTVVVAYNKLQKYGDRESLKNFISALLCCSGFVFLKLYDIELGTLYIFKIISGHFLSKICDFMQIHYVLRFYISLLKNIPNKSH